jgi:hypothetical protein
MLETSNNEIIEFLMTLIPRDGLKNKDLTDAKRIINNWNIIPLRIMLELNIYRYI